MWWIEPTATLMRAAAPILQAISWPIAAVVVAFAFRSQIKALLTGQLRKIKAGPFEAEFELTRAQVEAQVGAPPRGEQQPGLDEEDELRKLARISPTAAVLEAYARVEQVLLQKVQPIPQERHRPMGAVALARFAAQQNLISEAAVRAIEGISVLRNLTAHGPRGEVTPHQALDYLNLVDAVLYALNQPYTDAT